VKPSSADDTSAQARGKVGRCLAYSGHQEFQIIFGSLGFIQ
jgi:hypothetical protein